MVAAKMLLFPSDSKIIKQPLNLTRNAFPHNNSSWFFIRISACNQRGMRVFDSPDISIDPFRSSPLKTTRPVDVSESARLMTDVMLSSIRPSIRPLTGAARDVALSTGAARRSVMCLVLNSISTSSSEVLSMLMHDLLYSVKPWSLLLNMNPAMKPVKVPVTRGIRATEALKEIPG